MHSGWRSTLDALPGPAFALRPDGRIEFLNRFYDDYSGSRVELHGSDRWAALVHPADLRATETAIADGLASGDTFRIRHRIRSRDGAYRSYDSTTSPFRDQCGAVTRWLGIATDVDEQARTLALLAESEQHLREFVSSVPLIVWTADPTGWIDRYNPRWYEFTGQTAEEAAGWGWQDAHHPDDFPEVMRRWPHSIATGEPFEMEFRLRRHDGVFRWMLTRVVPSRDASGNIVRWYGSNTDIDDHKSIQQRSSRVAQLLQGALLPASLPSGAGFRLDAVYKPAQNDGRIGGDWYDAMRLADGRIFVSVGDVVGHGVEAASHAAKLRQSLAFAGIEDADPARILARVNAFVLAAGMDIATAAVAIFDPRSMELTYALAGHPPPVIALTGEAGKLGAYGGTPLGVGTAFDTSNHVVRLTRDAVFVLYTDGITEHGRDIDAAERALCAAADRIVADPETSFPASFLRDASLAGAHSADDTAVLVLQATSQANTGFAPFEERKTWRFHSSHALSARNARREVAKYLASVALDPQSVFEAELVLGEILANTVEHAPGLVEIEIDWSAAEPHILVRDDGPGWPHERVGWPADSLSEDGRGLPLIYALASQVAVDWSPGAGSTISCRLPIKRAVPGAFTSAAAA